MSLYSAMYAGVSGLKSQSTAMATIADNIANVSTVGYKATNTTFSSLVTKNTTSTSYSAGGVLSNTQQQVDVQGSLAASSSTSDIAISGDGFFIVNTIAEPTSATGMFAYTRAGSFSVDEDGYLVNSSGYYLMGWTLQVANGSEPSTSLVDINGTTYTRSYTRDDGSSYYVNTNVVDSNELQALNLNTIGGTAQPTLNVSIGANLPADYDVGDAVETTISVYDAFGITHNIDWTWNKSSANNWDLATSPPPDAATVSVLNTDGGVYYSAGQLEFTGTWDTSTTLSDIDGITFSVSLDGGTTTVDYELDSNGASVVGNTAIDISAATSWDDVCTAIANQLNTADEATSGFNGTSGAATRFASDGYQSVIITQSGNGDAIVVGDFVDNTTGGDMLTYLVTAGATTTAQPTFTVDQLDQTNGNHWGAQNFVLDTGFDTDFATVTLAGYDTLTFTYNGITYELDTNATSTVGNTAVDISAAADWDDIATAIAAALAADPQAAAGEVAFAAASGVITGTVASAVTDMAAVTFNGDGTPKSINISDLEVEWANGAQNMTGADNVNLFLGNENLTDGLIQLSAPYQINYLTQDGAKFGNFAGIDIDTDGVVTALFDNGVRVAVFQIPIATFVNDNGLEAMSGNAYIETDASGSYTLQTAGNAGAGTIQAGALETSTVDLSTEFTTMIVTQRAYSAASKVITTANDMMDDLLSIVR